MSTLGLLFKIKQAGAKQVQAEIKEIRSVFETELKAIGTRAGLASADLTSLTTGIGAVVGAVGILAGGVAVAAKGIFELAQHAADAGGKIYDLSQKVNFSAETLSTLQVVAKTAGSSIESVAASLGIFNKNLEAAAEGQKKMSALFKQFRIDITDNETALRQVFELLGKMPANAQQAALAMQFFGRSGKDVLGIIKETNGNLDEAIKKYDQMGLVISGSTAAASDKFNDIVDETNLQLTALMRTIGIQLLPVVTDAMKDISDSLTNNKEAWASWGNAIAVRVQDVVDDISGLVKAYKYLDDLNEKLYEAVRQEILLDTKIDIHDLQISPVGIAQTTPEGEYVSPGSSVPTAVARERDTRLDAVPKAKKAKKVGKTDAEKELERQLELYKKLEQELSTLANAFSGIDTKTREYAISQEILNGALEKASPGLKELALNSAKNIDYIQKQIEAQKLLSDFQEKQNEDVRQAIEGDKNHTQTTLDLISAYYKLGGVLDANQTFWLQFHAILLDVNDSFGKLIDLSARVDEVVGSAPGKASEKVHVDLSDLGPPPELALWKQLLDDIDKRLVSFSVTMNTTVVGAFRSMIGAVGDAVAAWALYGDSIAKALRKALAAQLAHIAAEATIQALYHAAYAIGKAALGDWGGAARHALAALKFAAVAVAAGLGARAIAGSAFQASGGATSSSGTTSSGGSTTTNTAQAVRDVNRTPGEPVYHFHFHGDAGELFKFKVVDTVVQDHRTNGPIRTMVTSER